MRAVIWAIGAMVISMLVLYLLPLGITKKGKLQIVFASFILSLCGLGAAHSFSILLTSLMLVVLIFFTAFFLDRRFGNLIFIERSPINQEPYGEIELENPIVKEEEEIGKEDTLRSLPVITDQSDQHLREKK